MIFRALIAAGLLISLALIDAGVASAATPSIAGTQATHITSTDATLEAEIDPKGASAGVFYQFQLLLDPGEGPTELACPSPLPGYSGCQGPPDPDALPLEWIPGDETQTVSLDLSSAGVTLTPGQTYYFRVLAADRIFTEDTAEWEPPAVVGASEEFTTPTVPSVVSESASNITQTNATLGAEIKLNEAPAGAYYQFQLVTDPSEYASEILCPPEPSSGPFQPCVGTHSPGALPISFLPGNTLEPSATSHASLDLASAGVTLQPGTTYHYRVLVARAVLTEDTIEWEPPAVFGADQTFTTSSAGAAPSIESESASNITQTNATLGAEIKLNEAPAGAYYQFQLVTDPSEYASEILCPPTLEAGYSRCVGPQGSGALPIGFLPGNTLEPSATSHASLDLASAGVTLQPGTTYHYRVLVARAVLTEDTIEWEPPAVFGADQTFTTTAPSLNVAPPSCAFSIGQGTCGGGPPNWARACPKKGQRRRHGNCVRRGHCRHHKRKHHRKHIRGGRLCKR